MQPTNTYINAQDVFEFIDSLTDNSVDLLVTDPPYMGIVKDSWDNQWSSVQDYVDWMYRVLEAMKPKMKEHGSVIFFGGIGSHNERPFFKVMDAIESKNLYTYRNFVTWGKRRAYGKSHDYLFCREEIVWYSMSPKRTEVTFNIPLTNIERGYEGYNKKYPAKSKFKRVTNVWSDIPELMRPNRRAEKPIPLMDRLVSTHSNKGDLVVDLFAGTGATGVSALGLKRRFFGCEICPITAKYADDRCQKVINLIST